MAQLIEKYKKVDLLILDEWLIRPLTPDKAHNMLEVVEARCGQTPPSVAFGAKITSTHSL